MMIQVLARAKATKNDLLSSANLYLIPMQVAEGYEVARYATGATRGFAFKAHDGREFLFETLDNIWLL